MKIQKSSTKTIQEWVWPRSDMAHWVPVLDRIDSFLENMVKEYTLPKQSKPFLDTHKEQLIASLQLTRFIWENCTNRAIYNSYEVSLGF